MTEPSPPPPPGGGPASGWFGKVPYTRLFRNTSLFGGVMGLNMLTNMGRMKAMALLLGPGGVGVFGLYYSVLGFLFSFISLSLSTSGVREIAEAWGGGNSGRAGEMYRVVRRVLVILGVAGSIGLFFCAEYASVEMFGDASQTNAFRWLSVIFVFSNLFVGQEALLQGVRRPGDAARADVTSNILGACCMILFLYLWGRQGLVPSLIAYPLIRVLIGWSLTRRVPLGGRELLSWGRTWHLARDMAWLGLVITLSGLVAMWSTMWIRAFLMERSGEMEVGYYTAAFSVSTYAIIFVSSSLSMEFFPRLSALREHPALFSSLVNRQVEVLVLLAAPFFLAGLVFSEWLFPLFYSESFSVATGAFRWFLCGAMAQLISWPMGLIRYAHKWVKLSFALELLSCAMHIGLIVWLYPRFGLTGLGMAFAILRFYEYGQNLLISRYVMGYRMDRGAALVSFLAAAGFAACFATLHWGGSALSTGFFLIGLLAMYLRGRSLLAGERVA